jgi:hypothetical protein
MGRKSGAPRKVRPEHSGFADTSPPKEGTPWKAHHRAGLTGCQPRGTHAGALDRAVWPRAPSDRHDPGWNRRGAGHRARCRIRALRTARSDQLDRPRTRPGAAAAAVARCRGRAAWSARTTARLEQKTAARGSRQGLREGPDRGAGAGRRHGRVRRRPLHRRHGTLGLGNPPCCTTWPAWTASCPAGRSSATWT